MQHFSKENWRKLNASIEQILSIAETQEERDKAELEKNLKMEIEGLNEQLEDKNQFIKKLMKENMGVKN
jgi:tripartite-type tricarboxylate transporter receptor subunit TctC